MPVWLAASDTFPHHDVGRISRRRRGRGRGRLPPRLKLTEADIQPELDRRRPGQSKITSRRREPDIVQILSGTFEGKKPLATPICLWVKNEDARPGSVFGDEEKFRPSHADFTYFAKYGIRNWQGGGRASARETIGRVAAGAMPRKFAGTIRRGKRLLTSNRSSESSPAIDPDKVRFKDVESNIVRCSRPESGEGNDSID